MAAALRNYFTSSANGQGSEFCTVRDSYNVCDFALLATYKKRRERCHGINALLETIRVR